jgi:hypothetical protein
VADDEIDRLLATSDEHLVPDDHRDALDAIR